MSTLTAYTPFDVLIRNFFDSDSFLPATQTKTGHPVDIYEDEKGLHVQVACTGIAKEDIEVVTEGDILRVRYEKPSKLQDEKDRTYYTQGIAKRSFNLGYKIASRFDIKQSEATFENGLLNIDIPFTKTSAPSRLKIR